MPVPNETYGKRQQILEAASRVFASNGCYQTMVEEIAIEAQVGKGTVYEYFKSKQDLFQELLKHILEQYLKQIFNERLMQEDSLKSRLEYLIQAHLQFLKEHREMARLFLAEHLPLDNNFKKWLLVKEKERLRLLQGYVEQGISTGEIRELDSAIVAKLLFGVINGMATILITEDEKDLRDLRSITKSTVDILYRGLVY